MNWEDEYPVAEDWEASYPEVKDPGALGPSHPGRLEERLSTLRSVAGGVLHPLASLGKGVSNTLGLPGTISQEDLDAMGLEAGATTPGKVAEAGSNVALSMLPANKMIGAGKFLTSMLPRAVGGEAALQSTLASGRGEGVEGQTEAAKTGALGGLLGMVPAAVVEGASRLVPASAEAMGLLGRGIVPTPGQGGDLGTTRGRFFNWLEDQLEAMPLSGWTTRHAREAPRQEFTDQAMAMGRAPGTAPSTAPTREGQIFDQEVANSNLIGGALQNTNIPVRARTRQAAEDWLDDYGKRTGLSQGTVDRVKGELESRLWEGSMDKVIPANTIANVAKNMMEGSFQSVKGDANAAQMVKDLGVRFKGWVDTAATQAGHPMADIRKASAVTHVLDKARGTDQTISPTRLPRAVLANNRKMSSEGVTPELSALANDARVLGDEPSLWQLRNIGQVGRELLLGAPTAGAGQVAALGYGGLTNSELMRKLLLGDPTAREAILRALNPAATAGATSLLQE